MTGRSTLLYVGKKLRINTNGDSFLNMARWIPFSIIRKESFDVINLEAHFSSATGLLEDDRKMCTTEI
jgi:hypothetical protein